MIPPTLCATSQAITRTDREDWPEVDLILICSPLFVRVRSRCLHLSSPRIPSYHFCPADYSIDRLQIYSFAGFHLCSMAGDQYSPVVLFRCFISTYRHQSFYQGVPVKDFIIR